MTVKVCSILLVLLLFSCNKKKQSNVVFILVDDLGWTDLGYSGSSFYETKNIDSFKESSIQFTNAYASASVCSPSRASILTGKYPARLNLTDWIPGDDPQDRKLFGPKDLNELPLGELTIAEALKKEGYKTFFIGKWHLGGEGFLPQDQGFDVNIGGFEKGSPVGGYYSPYKNPYLSDGIKGEFLTDRLTDESINCLDSVNNDPFFLFLSYYSVHTPIQANRLYVEKFKKKSKNLDGLSSIQKKEGKAYTRLAQTNPEYASMIYDLDLNIGKLIKKLKEKGLYNNTLIIFTSDNGGLSTLAEGYNFKAPTSVLPLRGGKGWLYEGGIRVPLLIKPIDYHSKNKTISEPVIGCDFFSTILSQSNFKIDKNLEVDGLDLSPLLNGNNTLKTRNLYWHYPHYHGSGWTPGAAIRQGDWKLIEFYETQRIELYNLSDDISEKKDLSFKYPEKVAELSQKLHQLQASMHANKTTFNKKPN